MKRRNTDSSTPATPAVWWRAFCSANRKRLFKSIGALGLTSATAFAGTFSNDFNTDPIAAGVVAVNGATAWAASGGVDNSGYVSLTDAVNSLQSSLILPDLDNGQPIGGFVMQFKLRIGGGSARPADGMSISFGPEVDESANPSEEGMGTGIVFAFDTYDNAGADTAPAIDVKVGGNGDANIVATATTAGQRDANRAPAKPLTTTAAGTPLSLDTGANFVDVRIELRDGLLTLSYAGTDVFKGIPVTFTPTAGRFVIAARTGGANEAHWIDDLQITTLPPSTAPTITGFLGTPLGVVIRITDAVTALNPSSIALKFDNATVTPIVSKSGDVTTIRYSASSALSAGTSHTASLTYADNAATPATKTANLTFTVPAFVTIPTDYAVASGVVDRTKPGFKIRTYETEENNPNTISWTEDQLAGFHGPNLADLSAAEASGFFTRDTVINFDINGGPAGNFDADEPIPGLPGTGTRDTGTGNAAAEILTYLEFPAAGAYTMGVNSDDGFRVTTAKNFDRFGLRLGEFNAARGAADTLFTIVVPQAGIYPFRLVWQNGGGGANLEWFTVDDNGTKVLVNSTEPNAIKAYREGRTLPFVRSVSPSPDSALVPVTTNLTIRLANGTTAVNASSIQLSLNGQVVTPVVTPGNGSTDTVITYKPATNFTRALQNIRLVYSDNGTPATTITNNFSFSTEEELLIGINESQMWRYENNGADLGTAWREKNYNDSGWINQEGTAATGAALIAQETGATPEPIRTVIQRSNANGDPIITDYFRTHFTFNGDLRTARLVLRHVVDDGVVVYLNGTEVYRFGVAANQNYQTLATDHENTWEGPFEISPAALVAGDNVIAAEVHQTSATSSDIVFGLQLSYKSVSDIDPPTVVKVAQDSGAGTVTVSFSELMELASATNVANYVINPANGGPRLGISAASVVSGTNVVLTVSGADAGTFYAINVAGARDLAGNPVAGTRLLIQNKILVGINSTQMWRYENNGRDLGTAWKEKSFDDSGWVNQAGQPATGAALLALETGATAEPIRTPIVRTTAEGVQVITDYFRTHFSFSGDPASVKLLLRHVVDDGVVVYLNGTEVYRFGVAAGQNFETLATDHENRYEGPFEIPSSALVAGDNVIAAELHQGSASSSDAVFGLELAASTTAALPPQTVTTVIPIDANLKWKYNNTAQDLGTAWKESGFNDASWPEGAALFALETGAVAEPIRTPLVRTTGDGLQVITDYFRTRFNFTGNPARTQLSVRHVVDDGIVVYLNGTEVYRFGVPSGQNYQTLATDHENRYEGPFDILSSPLKVGENVIAVELHQSSAGSSDSVFGLQLIATETGGGTVDPGPINMSIARRANGLEISWTGGGTLQSSDLSLPVTWTPVTGAISAYPLTADANRRFFRVVR